MAILTIECLGVYAASWRSHALWSSSLEAARDPAYSDVLFGTTQIQSLFQLYLKLQFFFPVYPILKILNVEFILAYCIPSNMNINVKYGCPPLGLNGSIFHFTIVNVWVP